MAVPLALLLAVQVAQAGVSGTVRGELTGVPLGGALITLSDLDREVLTDARGRFGFGALPPGPHHVTIAHYGYESRTLHALVPRTGQLELNIALQPVPVELDGLFVEPRLPIRGAEDIRMVRERAESVSIAAIRNHPLLAEPDVFRVLEGGDVAVLPESPTGLHVRGGASSHTGYEIDGIPVLTPVHAGGIFSTWNADAMSSVHLTRATSGVLPSLSGSVVGVTRAPGAVQHGTAAVSTTQARMTAHGPFTSGAGYVLSLRSGFPGGVLAPRDPAKIRGESGDLLAKVELPFFGGRLKLLGYDSENELNAGAVADPTDALLVRRHGFEWGTRSLGATWEGSMGSSRVAVRAWDSRSASSATLRSEVGDAAEARSGRTESGVMATLARPTSAEGELLVGVRLSRGSTAYRAASSDPFESQGALSSGALLLGYELPIARRGWLRAEIDLTASSLGATASPLLVAGAGLGRYVTVSAGLFRRHQFVQSMRNEESLLGAVFPADLFVTAGSAGVPTARADEASLRMEFRPLPGLSVGGRAYARRLDSVAFIAPGTGSLFSTGALEIGSASVRGLSVDAAVSGSRIGLVADYGFQNVHNRAPGRTYVPSYAPTHRAQLGVVFHPSSTMSLRLASAGAWGRTTTALVGPVEWEACNLADNGCEFAGAAEHGEELGETRLGAYIRTDLGLRKHWHLSLGGRDAMLALHGTLVNVLNRKNTLNYEIDPLTGSVSPIDMLGLAPLVVGVGLAF